MVAKCMIQNLFCCQILTNHSTAVLIWLTGVNVFCLLCFAQNEKFVFYRGHWVQGFFWEGAWRKIKIKQFKYICGWPWKEPFDKIKWFLGPDKSLFRRKKIYGVLKMVWGGPEKDRFGGSEKDRLEELKHLHQHPVRVHRLDVHDVCPLRVNDNHAVFCKIESTMSNYEYFLFFFKNELWKSSHLLQHVVFPLTT